MIKKYTILTFGLAITTSCFSAQPTNPSSTDYVDPFDTVKCVFTPTKSSKRPFISFLALENLWRQNAPEITSFSISYYNTRASKAPHKMEKTFYKCILLKVYTISSYIIYFLLT